jgi:energy-coupling factor transport system ATP-binding protein
MQGSVRVSGLETGNVSLFDLSKKVGTVLQDSDGQFIGLSVGEDIAFSMENDCVDQAKMKETVQQVADMVDMGTLLKSSPFELSGGQKQRVAFAGVMVDDVDVLLFDEPLANLDPATGKTAIDLIDRIQQQSKKTVVIIEHRLEDVLYRHVDRIVVVAEGRIVADSTPDELMATRQLTGLGIREPLYVTAMKYAGVTLTPQMRAGQLETLQITDEIRQKVSAWCQEPVASQPPATREILSAEHLDFQYDKKRKILQDINFSIKEGEMVSIVGTNGAGKSTLAKVICGFVKEDRGDIRFQGESLKGQTIKERSGYISYVMQNPNQMICKAMIYDEVALGLQLRGDLSEDEIRQRVEKALKICGLYQFRKWPISALSFGQKKRVTIASMLVMDPKVLILDEPTAGQDYRHYTEIMEFLKELNAQGVTIILITHDMHLMLEYTPHAIVINDGHKIADGTAVEILTNQTVAEAASLKLTSLYEFGLKLGLPDPQGLVQHFIDYEREVCRG